MSSGNEEQRAILDSAAYWGTPISTSYPDCGAVPQERPPRKLKELTEESRRAIAFSAIAGMQMFTRKPDESFQDFRARIDARMKAPEDHPEAND